MTMVSDANAFTATPIEHAHIAPSPDFAPFAEQINANYQNLPSDTPIFKTDVDLWPIYLSAFPEELQQEHNCNCCKQFIRNIGSTVYVTKKGELRSVLWDTLPDYGFFNPIVEKLAKAVESAKISGLYCNPTNSGGPRVGVKHSGGWDHLYTILNNFHYSIKGNEAHQWKADVAERFKMVQNAVTKYDHTTVNTALGLVESGVLDRPEKIKGPLEWFYNLGESFNGVAVRKGVLVRANLIWRAVATAPVGFSNISSSVYAALLDDLQDGVDTNVAIEKHNTKMRGDNYMRPKAAPSMGNVHAANKLIEELGYKRSFDRRFARLEDLTLAWHPHQKPSTVKAEAAGGLFDALLEPEQLIRDVRFGGTMTWARFEKTILANAESIEVLVPSHGNFFAFTAPVHDDAPIMFQWNNGVGAYSYVNGSQARQWNLHGNSWQKVTGISHHPTHWGSNAEAAPNHANGIFLLIEGCVDTHNNSLAIFPETLKSELHPARATIEVYAKTRKLEGMNEATACGLTFSDGTSGVKVRVVSRGVRTECELSGLY